MKRIRQSANSTDVTAPLPLGGLRMDFLITPEVYLRSSRSLFYLELGDYTGAMQDVLIACVWVPFDHFGVGLGLNTFRLGVTQDGSASIPGVSSTGSVEFGYTGLALYIKGLF